MSDLMEVWEAPVPQKLVLRYKGRWVELPEMEVLVPRRLKLAVNTTPEDAQLKIVAGQPMVIATFEVDEEMTEMHGCGTKVFYGILSEREETPPPAPHGRVWKVGKSREVKVWR